MRGYWVYDTLRLISQSSHQLYFNKQTKQLTFGGVRIDVIAAADLISCVYVVVSNTRWRCSHTDVHKPRLIRVTPTIALCFGYWVSRNMFWLLGDFLPITVSLFEPICNCVVIVGVRGVS